MSTTQSVHPLALAAYLALLYADEDADDSSTDDEEEDDEDYEDDEEEEEEEEEEGKEEEEEEEEEKEEEEEEDHTNSRHYVATLADGEDEEPLRRRRRDYLSVAVRVPLRLTGTQCLYTQCGLQDLHLSVCGLLTITRADSGKSLMSLRFTGLTA
jgi:hypothetical protein